MKKILHISYELRDRPRQEITRAVHDLIDASTRDCEVAIVDLVRVEKKRDEKIELVESQPLVRIDSFGLPLALLLRFHLDDIYKKIVDPKTADHLGLDSVDIIHSHKLSYEGVIGDKLSLRSNVPHVVTLRQTDFSLCRARPDVRAVCRGILSRCSAVFYIMPFVKEEMRKIFGSTFYARHLSDKMVFLPNMVDRGPRHGDRSERVDPCLLTVLRMSRKSVRRKNIRRLLIGFARAGLEECTLRIAGRGDFENRVRRWVSRRALSGRVVFSGSVPNEEIDRLYRRSRAFVLPSKRETFGLVYVEALLNGTPILYSRGTGVDGLFPDAGVSVNPRSVSSIARGLRDVYQNSEMYRRNIERIRETGGFDMFTPSVVYERYRKTLDEILVSA